MEKLWLSRPPCPPHSPGNAELGPRTSEAWLSPHASKNEVWVGEWVSLRGSQMEKTEADRENDEKDN